jgi:hypothetical protein
MVPVAVTAVVPPAGVPVLVLRVQVKLLGPLRERLLGQREELPRLRSP